MFILHPHKRVAPIQEAQVRFAAVLLRTSKSAAPLPRSALRSTCLNFS